jgi:hypothetical protein
MDYILKYKDILNLEGIGWISYVPFHSINLKIYLPIQLSIETKKDSIDMVYNFILICWICTVDMIITLSFLYSLYSK